MSGFDVQRLVGALILLVIVLTIILRASRQEVKDQTYTRVVRLTHRERRDLPRHATR